MNDISTNYRELSPDEVDTVGAECALAWQRPEIPLRQYELAVQTELERFRRGGSVAPYDALVRIMRMLPVRPYTLLDVGASSGYYSEVLEHSGYSVSYTGLDYSENFQALAQLLYPGMRYTVADARRIPYPSDTFDIVLSGATIMHVRDYPQVIHEIVRVSSRYVIFHRTPVHHEPTRFYIKDAYGIPCLEIHFNEDQLMALFRQENLQVIAQTEVSAEHRTYLLEKLIVEPYVLNHHQV